jgi:GNAT superfamily N-acetyltransferase
MSASILHFFPAYYDEPQVEASLRYVGVPDRDLIDDGTYFVAEVDGELIACGGWSKRDKLYSGSDTAGDWGRRGLGRRIIEESELAANAAGFTTMSLMATLPGEALYAACGFREIERADVITPNGTTLPCVAMEKPIG